MKQALLAALLIALACSEKKMPPPLGVTGNPNGGGGGGGPPGGGQDGGAQAVSLAPGQPSPRGLAVDGAYVYFACAGQGPGTGSVRRVAKNGGMITELATMLDEPYAIALTSDEVIFSEHAPSAPSGNLRAISKTPSGAVRTIATSIETPSWLALDATWIYHPTAASGGGVTLRRVPIAGGPIQDVAQTLGAFTPGGVVVTPSWVYFTAGTSVYRAPPSGGGPESLDMEANAFFVDVALAADRLWITDAQPKTGRVISVSTSGGNPRVDVAGVSAPTHVASDGRFVYFTTSDSVGAVSIADGSVVVLQSGLDAPFAIAVDDAVYVTTATDVERIPKL